MSRKTKIIILIAALILIIIAVVLVVIVNNKPVGNLPVNQAANSNQPALTGSLPAEKRLIINDNTGPAATADATELTAQESEQVILEKTALAFAARFGSYSSDSNYSNIRDLQSSMTESMSAWADKYITQQKAKAAAGYFGVTTRALGIKSSEISADTATIIVATQRRETTSDVNNYKVYNKDLRLVFKKLSDVWLVDAAYWQ